MIEFEVMVVHRHYGKRVLTWYSYRYYRENPLISNFT